MPFILVVVGDLIHSKLVCSLINQQDKTRDLYSRRDSYIVRLHSGGGGGEFTFVHSFLFVRILVVSFAFVLLQDGINFTFFSGGIREQRN